MSDRDQDPNARHPDAEIIPPGAAPVRWQAQPNQEGRGQQGPFPGQSRVWAWSSDPRYGRLPHRRPGPLGMLVVFAALAALGALGFFVFLGAVAITLPLIAAMVIVGVIGSVLRRL